MEARALVSATRRQEVHCDGTDVPVEPLRLVRRLSYAEEVVMKTLGVLP